VADVPTPPPTAAELDAEIARRAARVAAVDPEVRDELVDVIDMNMEWGPRADAERVADAILGNAELMAGLAGAARAWDETPQGEIERLRAERDEARSWARHGYELGQRSTYWTDHGVAPSWLTEGWPNHFEPFQDSSADAPAGHGPGLGSVQRRRLPRQRYIGEDKL
jgi:hypothetical protein